MRRLLPAAMVLLLPLISACGKADAGAGAPGAGASAAAPGDPPVTEVDFEEEADRQIDASSMESELAALEREIANDK